MTDITVDRRRDLLLLVDPQYDFCPGGALAVPGGDEIFEPMRRMVPLFTNIAVTQDWGLAAMLLGRGVRCLSPTGREYRDENIDFLLEERNLKARYRQNGGRTRGPKKRSPEQDARFQAALERLLNQK